MSEAQSVGVDYLDIQKHTISFCTLRCLGQVQLNDLHDSGFTSHLDIIDKHGAKNPAMHWAGC